METVTGHADELILVELEIIHDSYETGLVTETFKATEFSQSPPDEEGYFCVGTYVKTQSGILLETKQFTKVRYFSTKLCNRQYLEEDSLPSMMYN